MRKRDDVPFPRATKEIGDVYTQASCVLVICCLTSNAYHAGYALSMTRLLKTKRSIIVSDFWFEDFFLLVIDGIKPPGTYFNNNIDCTISLIVDL